MAIARSRSRTSPCVPTSFPTQRRSKMSRTQSSKSFKVRATLYLPADVLEEARNATVHLAGYPLHLTLTKLAENALRAELARLKTNHNRGEDFPPRGEDLRGGRPIAA